MKVNALALGTGYAETSSWSQFLLVHPEGFDSVQEALEDVRGALLDVIGEELQRAKDFHERQKKWVKESPNCERNVQPLYTDEFVNSKPEDHIEEVFHTIIHGNYQDYGDFWEFLSERGWLSGMSWNGTELHKYPFILVDNTPQLLVDLSALREDNYCIQTPDGVKVLK